ncbi:uncharacterized protein N7515_009056 [Penicillium bovifimosum]|uniref:Uncharacterized protein n=1 Tax=Penicillium bovifimosum TaxID=126998 RepID=A0A9W9GIJ1_9EURO|nr:uncharacterized protein N7515_009056 [Penicillium bovifimosum]KAJ5121095.1 hypothetical protein N7515_009056 [Penicillium bovifimosum]
MSASGVSPQSTQTIKAPRTSDSDQIDLPQNEGQWAQAAEQQGYEPADLNLHKKTSETLRNFPEWKAYLDRFGNPDDTGVAHRELGCFLIVKEAQQKVPMKPARWTTSLESDSVAMEQSLATTRQRREIPRPSYVSMASGSDSQSPLHSQSGISAAASDWSTSSSAAVQVPTKDEQIVNDALLLLLRALLIYVPEARDVRCQWEVDRSAFDANDEVFAIAEVKPNARSRKRRPEVPWQETGEMIAWLMHDVRKKRERPPPRRLVVSQANRSIYLTLASCDARYIEYLKSGLIETEPSLPENPRPELPLLRMQEYGPWNISEKGRMKNLARVIVMNTWS